MLGPSNEHLNLTIAAYLVDGLSDLFDKPLTQRRTHLLEGHIQRVFMVDGLMQPSRSYVTFSELSHKKIA